MGNILDYATSTVATAPSPADSGTSLTVASGHGSRFPATPFNVTAHPANEIPTLDNSEKLTVTNKSGDVFTIERAQGDTTAKSIAAGWRITNALFKEDLDAKAPLDSPAFTGKVYVNGEQTLLNMPGELSLFIGDGGTYNESYSNSAVGYYSLSSNTYGSANSAMGYSSLSSNTEGSSNSAIGAWSLGQNTTGSSNSAIGDSSLSSNTTGTDNSAIGSSSLGRNTTGSYNSGVGVFAGHYIASGSTPNKTGNNSVFLGAYTKAQADAQTNQTVIGYNAIGNGSNTVTIGNSSVTGNFFRGNIESTTVSGGVILKSPDGTRYKLTIANGGTVSVTAA